MNWYALRSKPHKEFLLHEQLVAREIECFFPRIKVVPINPRSRKVRPYFPGYLFVRADLDEIGANTFKWMPYAQHLVSFDGIPATIPPPIINQIQTALSEINEQGGLKLKGFGSGDKILVASGPFEGYEGIFDTQLNGSERVKILLRLIGDKQVPIEMDADQIISKENKSKGFNR